MTISTSNKANKIFKNALIKKKKKTHSSGYQMPKLLNEFYVKMYSSFKRQLYTLILLNLYKFKTKSREVTF